MRAVQLALIHFGSTLLKSKVLSRCDNSTVVSYFNREEGTKSFQLCWFGRYFNGASATIHADVSSNTDLSSLIKGIFNSNPCVEPLYPKRDLPLVLLALCKTSIWANGNMSLKVIATSWALFNAASLPRIIQAAHWASKTTFTAFCLMGVGSDDSFCVEDSYWVKIKRRK